MKEIYGLKFNLKFYGINYHALWCNFHLLGGTSLLDSIINWNHELYNQDNQEI